MWLEAQTVFPPTVHTHKVSWKKLQRSKILPVTSTVTLFWCFPTLMFILLHATILLPPNTQTRLLILKHGASQAKNTLYFLFLLRRGNRQPPTWACGSDGGGRYRQALLTGQGFAFIAGFTLAHRIMGGVAAWQILHVCWKKEKKREREPRGEWASLKETNWIRILNMKPKFGFSVHAHSWLLNGKWLTR